MSARQVTVIDYGVGNLYSVHRALEFCGAESVVVSSSAKDIDDADRLILPGVGAFSDGMAGLEHRGLIEPIRRYAATGRPLMGICLGMQMLASESEEFGHHEGLGLIPGRVVAIPHLRTDGSSRKIPAIGWFSLAFDHEYRTEQWVSNSDSGGCVVYLVHSYHFQPNAKSVLIATYEYDGLSIAAIVRQGNVVGVQFHPEKSGAVGLRIIRRFLDGFLDGV